LRKDIREGLAQLSARPGGILTAELRTTASGFFDAENVLLYNVGAAAYNHLSEAGLAFIRREIEPPPCPQTLRAPPAYYHQYTIAERAPGWPLSVELARWRFRIDRMSSSTHPHDVWAAMRTGTVTTLGSAAPHSLYYLDVDIDLPPRRRVGGVVKSLLDGIICGLHVDTADDADAARLLADRLGWKQALITAELLDERSAVLGPIDLLRTYRDFVKWNPADDRCFGAYIRVMRDGTGICTGRVVSA